MTDLSQEQTAACRLTNHQHRLLQPTRASRVEHERLEHLALHRGAERRQARVADLRKERKCALGVADAVAFDPLGGEGGQRDGQALGCAGGGKQGGTHCELRKRTCGDDERRACR